MRQKIWIVGLVMALSGMGYHGELFCEEVDNQPSALQAIPAKLNPQFLGFLASLIRAQNFGVWKSNASISLAARPEVGEIHHFHTATAINTQTDEQKEFQWLESAIVLLKGYVDGKEGLLIFEVTPRGQKISSYAILVGSKEVLKLEGEPVSDVDHLVKKLLDEAQSLDASIPKESI